MSGIHPDGGVGAMMSNKLQGDEDPEDAKARSRRANLSFVVALLVLASVTAIDSISALYLQVIDLFHWTSHVVPLVLFRISSSI